MKRAAVAAAFLMLLAGCVEPEPSVENLTLSISDVGKMPYVIGIPLYLSGDGPNATAWMERATVHSGQVTQFHLTETPQGTAMRIAGNGTVTIGFDDVRHQAGAHFTDAAFSLGTGPGGTRPLMLVETGDVDVQWFYEGVTDTCFATGSFWWQANGTGIHEAQLGGRMSFDSLC